jgi:hypothetical protein
MIVRHSPKHRDVRGIHFQIRNMPVLVPENRRFVPWNRRIVPRSFGSGCSTLGILGGKPYTIHVSFDRQHAYMHGLDPSPILRPVLSHDVEFTGVDLICSLKNPIFSRRPGGPGLRLGFASPGGKTRCRSWAGTSGPAPFSETAANLRPVPVGSCSGSCQAPRPGRRHGCRPLLGQGIASPGFPGPCDRPDR